jgi:hypothetical protein
MNDYFIQIKRILNDGIDSKPLAVIDKTKYSTINDLFQVDSISDNTVNWWPSCSKAQISKFKFQVHLNIFNKNGQTSTNTILIKEESDNLSVFKDVVFSELKELLKEEILIVAGHYMPDIRNLNLFPNEPYKALLNSIEFLKSLNKRNVDYLILLNDLSLGSTEYLSKTNREMFIENYHIPELLYTELSKLKKYGVRRCLFINERKLFLKLNRERKSLLNSGKLVEKVDDYGSKYLLNSTDCNDIIISNITNDVSKGYYRCVGAVNRLIKLAEDLNYKCIVNFYPYCSIDTVTKGINHSRQLYDVKIPILNIFSSFTCFKNKTKS